jgi:hypothetical protein
MIYMFTNVAILLQVELRYIVKTFVQVCKRLQNQREMCKTVRPNFSNDSINSFIAGVNETYHILK